MKEMILLCILLGVYGIWDMKRKSLPLWLIGLGIGLVFLTGLVDSRFTSVYSVSGILAGVLVIAVSVVSRGQIGMADGMVFLITGLYLNIWQNLALLLVSLILLAVPAAVFFLKQQKERELPFLPGVFLGFIILWAGGGFSV